MNRNQKRQKVEEHDLILMKSLTHLVPFIGKLLSGQSPLHLPHPALRSSRVKISTHEQIAHEAIEALQPLIRDAVFDELSRWGVRRLKYCDTSRGDVREGRLWEQPSWPSFTLRFSDQSMNIAIRTYQMAYPGDPAKSNEYHEHQKRTTEPHTNKRGDKRRGLFKSVVQAFQGLSEDFEGQYERTSDLERAPLSDLIPGEAEVGDLLFHLLCYQRLKALKANSRPEAYLLSARMSALNNPLYLLMNLGEGLEFRFHRRIDQRLLTKSKDHFTQIDFEPLLNPTFEVLWPWLSSIITERWLDLEPLRWRSNVEVEHRVIRDFNFQKISWRQRSCFEQLCEFAERHERLDLLIPFIGYYQGLPQKMTPGGQPLHVVSSVNFMFEEFKLSEREPLLSDFVEHLRHVERLVSIAKRIERSHPIDREWSDKLYLSVYQATEMAPALHALRQIIQTLRPEIG